MLNLNKISNIFFIGIGGAGMSALAQYFKLLNYNVFGYDANLSDFTDLLESKNISISYTDNTDIITSLNPINTLVIYTPAIDSANNIYNYFRNNNFAMYKRAEVLANIFNSYNNKIAIAGTHGKTTITALVSHILNISPYKPIAFIGGISLNYHTNLLYNQNPKYIITEADEFNNSFLLLNPTFAIISSIENDHFDTFNSYNEIISAFQAFARLINRNGYLVVHESIAKYFTNDNIFVYSGNSKVNKIANVKLIDNYFYIDIQTEFGKINKVRPLLYGTHNYENMLAATILLQLLNIDNNIIKEGIETFKGVKRRFEIVYQTNNITIIDDYAHHPTAIAKTIETARKIFKNKKITVIFQPHLYSRTLHLYNEFAESLSLSDEVILFDIYAAREKPIKNVSSAIILDKIKIPLKTLSNFDNIKKDIVKNNQEIIIIMGAGNINKIKETLIEIYK
ncbi:MAG: UDP-N-acetylmuramate--L-alanine ligase [Bacteroidales bacterium]|nr:UDP-N-acetylmuramate--L-alanine ligase [Bacteroidales bacterium]